MKNSKGPCSRRLKGLLRVQKRFLGEIGKKAFDSAIMKKKDFGKITGEMRKI